MGCDAAAAAGQPCSGGGARAVRQSCARRPQPPTPARRAAPWEVVRREGGPCPPRGISGASQAPRVFRGGRSAACVTHGSPNAACCEDAPEPPTTPVRAATLRRTREVDTRGGHSVGGVGLHAAEALTPAHDSMPGGQGSGAERGVSLTSPLSDSRSGLRATQGSIAVAWPSGVTPPWLSWWALE